METLTISVQKRDTVGTRATNALRKKGLIPAVLYGHGKESIAITLPVEVMNDCLKRNVRVMNLDLGGINDSAIIKDLQWDTFGYDLLHVDLMRVRMDEEVSMVVQLVSTGRAKGLDEDGVLDIIRNELTVKCLPSQIPESIEFDVSDLGVGDSLHIRDLVLPEGVVLDDDPDYTVASVTARVEVVEEVAEPAEGEEGEEGAAPAEGDEGSAAEEQKKDDKGDS